MCKIGWNVGRYLEESDVKLDSCVFLNLLKIYICVKKKSQNSLLFQKYVFKN